MSHILTHKQAKAGRDYLGLDWQWGQVVQDHEFELLTDTAIDLLRHREELIEQMRDSIHARYGKAATEALCGRAGATD